MGWVGMPVGVGSGVGMLDIGPSDRARLGWPELGCGTDPAN